MRYDIVIQNNRSQVLTALGAFGAVQTHPAPIIPNVPAGSTAVAHVRIKTVAMNVIGGAPVGQIYYSINISNTLYYFRINVNRAVNFVQIERIQATSNLIPAGPPNLATLATTNFTHVSVAWHLTGIQAVAAQIAHLGLSGAIRCHFTI